MCKLFVWFSLFSLHLLYHKSTYMSSGAMLLGLVRRHYIANDEIGTIIHFTIECFVYSLT